MPVLDDVAVEGRVPEDGLGEGAVLGGAARLADAEGVGDADGGADAGGDAVTEIAEGVGLA